MIWIDDTQYNISFERKWNDSSLHTNHNGNNEVPVDVSYLYNIRLVIDDNHEPYSSQREYVRVGSTVYT